MLYRQNFGRVYHWVALNMSDANLDLDSKQLDSDSDSDSRKLDGFVFARIRILLDPDSDSRCPDSHITGVYWSIVYYQRTDSDICRLCYWGIYAPCSLRHFPDFGIMGEVYLLKSSGHFV